MANPFFIQPVDVSQPLAGLGQVLGQVQDRKKKELRLAEFQEAFKGAATPQDYVGLATAFPEYSQAANLGLTAHAQQLGLEKTKMNDLYKRLYVSNDPMSVYEDFLEQNPDTKLTEAMLEDMGMAGGNPEAFKRNIGVMWASSDPTGFEAAQKAIGGALEADLIGKIDPGLYTPSSVEEFKKTQDYSVLIPRSNLSRADRVKLEAAETNLEAAKLKQQEAEREAEAESKKAEEADVKQIQATRNALNLVGQLSNPESIERLTGVSGSLPSFSGSEAGADEARLEQLQSLLTLENLSLMSGVLTDTDMRILQSAAATLRPGMNKDLLKQELKRIEALLNDKLAGYIDGGSKKAPQTESQRQASLWLQNNPDHPKAESIRQKLIREGVL